MCKKIDELMEENAKLKQALARVEAERDSAQLSVELWKEQYQSVVDCGNEIMTERDTAQAELAEAVGLLRKVAAWPAEDCTYGQEQVQEAARVFLARHAQAEQKEAQGAQANKVS